MYSDRKGNGQKSPRTKTTRQKTLYKIPRTKPPAKNGERICTAGFCPGFCTRPTKNRGGSKMCDVLLEIPGCVTKCDREGGGGSKLAKNSVTYFMEGPLRQSSSRRLSVSSRAGSKTWRNHG